MDRVIGGQCGSRHGGIKLHEESFRKNNINSSSHFTDGVVRKRAICFFHGEKYILSLFTTLMHASAQQSLITPFA